MEHIIIIGSSGHAGVVIDIVELERKYKIAGLLDGYKKTGIRAFGYTILGAEADLPSVIENYAIMGGLIAIGDNWTRQEVMKKLLHYAPDFFFVQAIHPSAQIGTGVALGQGSVIMPNCVLNRNVSIGEFCIINTGTSIDHDSRLGHFCSLSPGVRTGGNVSIGEFSAVGIGASIIHGIRIGNHTVIGAGAVVVKDVPDFVISYGVPAKIISARQIGEKYL